MSKTLGPLGLLPEFVSNSEIIKSLEAIERLDLTREKAVFQDENSDFAEFVHALERELKRFLALRILFPDPDYPLAPSILVDKLWHLFILDTEKYMTFCNSVFNEYIHHHPMGDRSEKRRAYSGELARYTKSIMEEAFGGLTVDIWGAAASCDTHGDCFQ